MEFDTGVARKPRKPVIRKSVLHANSRKLAKETSSASTPRLPKKKLCEKNKDSREYLEQLIRKVFGSTTNGKPVDLQDYLPALTSSQSVDLQLYAYIGLFLRQFVMGWYPGISYDPSMEFMAEILGVLAHVTRNLQQRCQRIDWPKLLLDDLPLVLKVHTEAIRASKLRRGSRLSSSSLLRSDDSWYNDVDCVADFLQLNPHFAIDLDDAYQEKLYCTVLSKSIVCLLVPFEELDSQLSQKLMTAIINDLVLKNIVESLSDSFALWGIINKVCDVVIAKLTQKTKSQSLSERAVALVRALGHLIAYTTSLFTWPSPQSHEKPSKPCIEYGIFAFLASLLRLSCVSPLLYIILTTVRAYGSRISRLSHIFNNLVQNFVYQVIVTESNTIMCFSVLRKMMFPQDETFDMGQRWVPANEDELLAFRKKTSDHIIELMGVLPMSPVVRYLIDLDAGAIDAFLESFQNKTTNKVLLWSVLDLLFVSIFPELAKYTPTEIESHALA